MVEPASIAATVLKSLGKPAGQRALEWAKGSEANRLVRLLKKDHPRAEHLLVQPAALGELWWYADTGELRDDAMRAAVRPVCSSDADARRLVESIRALQWRAMRDERRLHFDLRRLQSEMRMERHTENEAMLARIGETLTSVRERLPAARGLPAAIDLFVNREDELAEIDAHFAAAPVTTQGARIVCCSRDAGDRQILARPACRSPLRRALRGRCALRRASSRRWPAVAGAQGSGATPARRRRRTGGNSAGR